MKALRNACVLSVWFVLVVLLASDASLFAQKPKGTPKTIVIRGNDWFTNFEWDGDKTLLYYTSEPDWGLNHLCNDQPIVTDDVDFLLRIIASGKSNFFEKGPVQARLYYPATIDDVFPIENACSFVRNAQPAAEGISHAALVIQNGSEITGCPLGPGRTQFVFRLSGSLFNVSMPCPGRHVNVNIEHHFHLKQGAYVDPDTCSTDFSNIEVIKYVMDVHCLP